MDFYKIEKIEKPKELPDIPAYGTTKDQLDWCQDCGISSDIIYQGYGYCDEHFLKKFGINYGCECEMCKPKEKFKAIFTL